ncbi:hypothetical protein Si077_01544 [Streptococcus infantarius subsp. infantarius]|nr:hypothetical protein [Streptococcus infantarius subsp. infantarius]MCO4657599.1 hypothetical protein [Streptococcus infantarius subsp. infantarius]
MINKQEALKKIEKLEGLTIKDKDFNFPEITRYKTNQELEEEIEQLRSEVTTLKRCLGELKRTVASW